MDKRDFIRTVNAKRPPELPELDPHTLNELIQARLIDYRLPDYQVRTVIQFLGWIQEVKEEAAKPSRVGIKSKGARCCQIACWTPTGDYDGVVRRVIRERQIWHYAADVDVNFEPEDTLGPSKPFYFPELGVEVALPPMIQAALLKYRHANIVVPDLPRMRIYIDTIDYLPTDKPAEVWLGFLQRPVKTQSDERELDVRLGAKFSVHPREVLQQEQERMGEVLVDWSQGNLTAVKLDGLRPQFDKGLYYQPYPSEKWTLENVDEQPALIPVYRFYGWLDYCWFRFIEDIDHSVMPRLCEHCGLPLLPTGHRDRRYHRKDENLDCFRARKRLEQQRRRQTR